jgi:hypothetical protein
VPYAVKVSVGQCRGSSDRACLRWKLEIGNIILYTTSYTRAMGEVVLVLPLSCILLPAFFFLFLSTSRCESCFWFSLSLLADSFHDNPMTGYASVCLVRREGAGLTCYSQSQSSLPARSGRQSQAS